MSTSHWHAISRRRWIFEPTSWLTWILSNGGPPAPLTVSQSLSILCINIQIKYFEPSSVNGRINGAVPYRQALQLKRSCIRARLTARLSLFFWYIQILTAYPDRAPRCGGVWHASCSRRWSKNGVVYLSTRIVHAFQVGSRNKYQTTTRFPKRKSK